MPKSNTKRHTNQQWDDYFFFVGSFAQSVRHQTKSLADQNRIPSSVNYEMYA